MFEVTFIKYYRNGQKAQQKVEHYSTEAQALNRVSTYNKKLSKMRYVPSNSYIIAESNSKEQR